MPTTIMIGDAVARCITNVGGQLDVPPTALVAHTLCAALLAAYNELLTDDDVKALKGRVAGTEGHYKSLATRRQIARGQAVLEID